VRGDRHEVSTTERRVPWDVPAYRARSRSACFVCELLHGNPEYAHHVVHRDDVGIAFLSRYPQVWGHLLVAPIAHREHVFDDCTEDEYLAVQRLVRRAGRALTAVVPTERAYAFSLGSQQGNRHVHWHVAALPPGLPYEEQQFEAFAEAKGYIDVEDGEMAALASTLRRAMQEEQ
jgi:diadenosine tetraphosphate (Ap4A) HIT family hydrolase